MNLSKRKILINAFFNSQFSYYPLIWICHSRIINKKINRQHERCLRIIYCDLQLSFEELPEKDSSVSIHERNIQMLATEMYTVSKGMPPPQIPELFARKNEHPYTIRDNTEFLQPFVNSAHCRTESMSYLGPKIWGMVLWFYDTYKNIDSLYNSKRLFKNRRLKTARVKLVRFLSKI